MVLRGALELERQHVEQHFAVGVRVDVAKVELEQLALQFLAVGQVAVVAERDAERRVDVERLRLEVGERRAGGRIAAVADARVAHQVAHVAGAEHVLAPVPGPCACGRSVPSLVTMPRGVLPAMLQEQEAVVQQLVDGRVRDDADDSAHEQLLSLSGSRGRWHAALAGVIESLRPTPAAATAQGQRGGRERRGKGGILPPIKARQGWSRPATSTNAQ